MTCIVGVPGRIVADSRETGVIKKSCFKVWKKHGYLIGGAGDSGALVALEHVVTWPRKPALRTLARWILRTHEKGSLDFDEVSLVVVTHDAVFEIEGRSVSEEKVSAVGSGAPFALGYLRAVPEDLTGAVEAACYLDPYCAGPVREWTI